MRVDETQHAWNCLKSFIRQSLRSRRSPRGNLRVAARQHDEPRTRSERPGRLPESVAVSRELKEGCASALVEVASLVGERHGIC